MLIGLSPYCHISSLIEPCLYFLLQDIRLDEAKYLLEKLLSMTVNQCCLATQKDGIIKEMENRMNQVKI